MLKRKLKLLTAALAIWVIGHTPHTSVPVADDQRRDQRTDYLKRIVDTPFRDCQEVRALRFENPEWQLFTYSFATYAMANIAREHPEKASELAIHMRRAIDNATSPIMTSTFQTRDLHPATAHDHLAVYYGHLNLMMGLYREVSGDTTIDPKHKEVTQALHDAVMASPTRNVESYRGRIWPADNSVVMASLAVYDRIHGTDYSRAADEWANWINNNFLAENGLMHSEIHPGTGRSVDGPRGCSVAWTSMFARYFSPDFADAQYAAMKEHLGGKLLGSAMFKERQGSHATGIGDIDSGPMFLGYGVAATGLGYGAAVAAGDKEVAREIRGVIDAFGWEKYQEGERSYRVFAPLSDALVLFGETLVSQGRNNQ